MRDSVGGTVALAFVVVFIVVTLGYMAFNVNYTKAFRMKNKVISVYENYEGECDSACEAEIDAYAKKLGYNPIKNYGCPSGYSQNKYYCYQKKENNGSGLPGYTSKSKYYKIVTKINVNIPVINNIFDFRVFQITGDTRVFEEE